MGPILIQTITGMEDVFIPQWEIGMEGVLTELNLSYRKNENLGVVREDREN